jgi:uncharacterized membrane protein
MAVLAALSADSFGYRLLLLLHLVSMVIAFGAVFSAGLAARYARSGWNGAGTVAAASTQWLTVPALWLSGIFGVTLAGAGGFDFGKAWISIAFVLFLIAAGVATFMYLPNQLRIAALSASGTSSPELARRVKRSGMATGILHLCFIALMIDMIWKPGL